MTQHWLHQAACRGIDPVVWDLDSKEPEFQEEALRICNEVCPVKQACFDDIQWGNESGVIRAGILFGESTFRLPMKKCEQCGQGFTGHKKRRFCTSECWKDFSAAQRAKEKIEG